jgi:hypothetical protein
LDSPVRDLEVAAESFFGTLKNEMYYRQAFPDRSSRQFAVADYIEIFYNRQHRHSALVTGHHPKYSKNSRPQQPLHDQQPGKLSKIVDTAKPQSTARISITAFCQADPTDVILIVEAGVAFLPPTFARLVHWSGPGMLAGGVPGGRGGPRGRGDRGSGLVRPRRRAGRRPPRRGSSIPARGASPELGHISAQASWRRRSLGCIA